MPPQRSLPPLVRGGRRVEHPLARAPMVSPYSVTQGYRWIGDAQLPPGEKALLLTIFKLVDSRTWRWPPKTDERGGSALADLALSIDRSERQTRRILRALEARGVLAVADMRPHRSHYQILPEGLRALGEAGRSASKAAQRERVTRRAATMIAADAALDGLTGDGGADLVRHGDGLQVEPVGADTDGEAAPADPVAPCPEAVPGQAAAPSSSPSAEAFAALPAWATYTAQRADVEPALVAGLVRAAWRAAGSGQGTWLHEGALARPAIRAWRGLDRPPLARWEALMTGLASAREGGRLRGSFPKGWTWSPRGAVELLRLGWARLLAELEADAPARAPVVAPAPANQRELPGKVGAQPGDPERWAAGIAKLITEVGATMGEVWISPLALDGVQDGHVVVRCPSPVWVDWCASNYADELVRAAGGPVRLVVGR
ncbi:MAG: hypothetical protein JNM72_26415 [Deltaproteobacteria bacterium]|nr:hypothetical protein [Deltaproteobacteria bacterium]